MLDASKQLRKIRKERKLTLQAVCTGSGIPMRTYQNYEYGEREISAEALYKLAVFYGVTTDSLLGHEIEDPESKMNEKYRALSPQGKKAVEKFIDMLANSHKTKSSSQDRAISLTTVGEVLTTLGAELDSETNKDKEAKT